MIEFAAATWPEITQHIARVPVAVLAVGAIEQHGQHLPVGTDAYFADALARDLAQRVDGVLLPSLAYGNSWANERYGGTISISPQTLRSLICDVAGGFQRLGGRGLVLVNGDFGNQTVVALAAQELLQQSGLRCLHIFYPGMAEVVARHCATRGAGGTLLHADEFETALMLLLRPDLVHMDRARAEYPQIPVSFGAEPIYLDELSRSGTFGDPTAATAETGQRIYDDLYENAGRLCDAFVARLAEGQ